MCLYISQRGWWPAQPVCDLHAIICSRTPQPLLSTVSFKVSLRDSILMSIPTFPQHNLSFFNSLPSKTARHMVTSHNGITQQHHSIQGGQNNVKFSSNLTTWLPLSHKWWWSRKLVAATSWAGFVSPLLCLTHSCPLSRTNWQSSSTRATTLSSSISPRPPEHPWEMFLKRIQAIFAH